MQPINKGKFQWGIDNLDYPVCVICKHQQPGSICKAFPDGIPDEILMMENDHSQPIEGDHGIQFELKEGWKLPGKRIKR